MNSWKTLIVDDERLARQEMRRMLDGQKHIQIIDEAQNGDEAVDKITSLKPDLVFLDIQMPGKDGFQVLEAVQDKLDFEVIFTTAYDEFALKAFDFAATDYLLKPIEEERLNDALAKLHWEKEEEQETTSIKDLGLEDRLYVKDGNNIHWILLAKVKLFESVGNYVKIHYQSGKPMVLKSLNSLAQQLDEKHFFRANRKVIVNVAEIKSIEPYFSGSIIAQLESGEKVEFSRRQTAKFKEQFSL